MASKLIILKLILLESATSFYLVYCVASETKTRLNLLFWFVEMVNSMCTFIFLKKDRFKCTDVSLL